MTKHLNGLRCKEVERSSSRYLAAKMSEIPHIGTRHRLRYPVDIRLDTKISLQGSLGKGCQRDIVFEIFENLRELAVLRVFTHLTPEESDVIAYLTRCFGNLETGEVGGWHLEVEGSPTEPSLSHTLARHIEDIVDVFVYPAIKTFVAAHGAHTDLILCQFGVFIILRGLQLIASGFILIGQLTFTTVVDDVHLQVPKTLTEVITEGCLHRNRLERELEVGCNL